MPHVGKHRQAGKQHHEQHGDPSRRAWTLVMIRFLRARYVWRNTHSASSVNLLGCVTLRKGSPEIMACARPPVHAGIVRTCLRRKYYRTPRRRANTLAGQRASTEVVKPPRGVNSPRTMHHLGRVDFTMSRRILFTAFS